MRTLLATLLEGTWFGLLYILAARVWNGDESLITAIATLIDWTLPVPTSWLRDVIRGLPVACIGLGLIPMFFVIESVFPGQTTVARYTALVSLAVFAFSVVEPIVIMLFNRPKFLVPPRMRAEPGVIPRYLARRRQSARG